MLFSATLVVTSLSSTIVSSSVPLAVASVTLGGCGCMDDCRAPGLKVTVPDEAMEIRVTGETCKDAALYCGSAAPADENVCTLEETTLVFVESSMTGEWELEVDLPSGTVSGTVQFTEFDGCCAGVYWTPGGDQSELSKAGIVLN